VVDLECEWVCGIDPIRGLDHFELAVGFGLAFWGQRTLC